MRQAAKRDNNEGEIVAALEAVGCVVHRLSQKGVPDLLVGYVHPISKLPRTTLIEVKEPRGKLTTDQEEWHALFIGEVHIVRTIDEALEAVGR